MSSNSEGSEIRSAVKEAARLIRSARFPTAFTGAGVSAESGLPVFRGPDGLWSRIDPELFGIDAFRADPERVWPTLKSLFSSDLASVDPNAAHRVLARMEGEGDLKAVITQNVDSLHQRAGSRRVVEYHGSARALVCIRCRRRVAADEQTLAPEVPRCTCGGVLKPDVIFFGEEIPLEAAREAQRIARKTDVMLVVGSTGEVYPAAMIPRTAAARRAKIIEINPSPSSYTDHVTDVFIPLAAARGFTLLEEELYPPTPG